MQLHELAKMFVGRGVQVYVFNTDCSYTLSLDKGYFSGGRGRGRHRNVTYSA